MKLNRDKLLKLRTKKGWTQIEAAVRAGVSQPTYNRAENGKEIQPLKAQKIANAVRVPLSELEECSA